MNFAALGEPKGKRCYGFSAGWSLALFTFSLSKEIRNGPDCEIKGQGFAIWRKQKIQRAYKKLLKKERYVNPQKNVGYTEDYPEHLKHLYLAEEEMLRKHQKPKHKPVVLEEKETRTSNNVIQRKLKAKTSNQKAKEDYEKIKTERNEKKEVSKKRREEREKAQKLYKQKKMETYKILSKRTRKGQPNLNLQMEYLLQKIEQKA
uniref:Coiled-coil domain containing 59 n=1 Tax=Laticauda laticaudata TaxID=8630 RepID=A0A8C5RGV3_LATLA